MRVLHALRSDGFAGVERHIATLAAAQARAGHRVWVIGGDATRMQATLEGTGVRTASGNTTRQVAVQVRRLRGADVVHAHMTAAELAASLSTTRPIVVTRHFARPRGATPAGRLSGELIKRRVAAQIAISQYVADAVGEPTRVIYPGIEPDAAPPQGRRPVALVVQRLEAEKATDVAVRAFASGAPSDWSLEVVGSGSQLPSLQALAWELGVSHRVRFLGFRDDIPTLMRRSALLLAPCPVEGLGLAVLEAMAAGLPVIASRAGAHPETVGRATRARMFAPGSWQEAAEQLAILAAEPAARTEYGAELAEVQRTSFTPAAQVDATDEVYEAVLG